MREIETDYLVVGAGASGLSFTDSLTTHSRSEVVLVDRRHAPGGHWLDAYPFVRLHQPSAYYGVASRVLGQDRIDQSGPNAGLYERATADQIREYFLQVLEQHLVPSGQVTFFGMSDYRGEDSNGHHLVSLLTGDETVVKIRRKVVDATYLQSEIPARHAPPFTVEVGVRVIPPNDLVDLAASRRSFTVIGAGKTAMDTCSWLLDTGVDPDRIRWIRTRESWLFDRSFFQPLELVASFMRMQAHWLQAATEAQDGRAFAHLLEERGVFVRLDSAVEPGIFRAATISRSEVESLRTIERVVRAGRVVAVNARRLQLADGEVQSDPAEVYVDCTAAGTPPTAALPIFEPGRIVLRYVTIGLAPWSAATVGFVEAWEHDDAAKNRLCPPVAFSGEASRLLELVRDALVSQLARGKAAELSHWNDSCRLNPARGAAERMDDPEVASAYGALVGGVGPALRNLAQQTG